MTLKTELMNAILAMDAYNRGYDASIELDVNAIGNTQIVQTTLDGVTVNLDSIIMRDPITGERLDDNIGFYALAYDTDGDGDADVISYRGTDYPAEGQTTLGIPNDIYHGWSLGGGVLASEQGMMAIDFFKEVAGTGNPYINNDLILTGHSLGGGLSGFVGSIYNKEAYVYDAMAYELSAKRATNYIVDYSDAGGTVHTDEVISANAFSDFQIFYPGATLIDWEFQNPDYVDRITGGNHPVALDFDRTSGYYMEGEILAYAQMARADDADYSNSNSKLDILNGIYLLPNGTAIDEAIARHSQSTLVIAMFKDEVSSLTDWQAASKYFWPVLYDGGFAKTIGMDDPTLAGELQASANANSTTTPYADILRGIIAYSAIDEGERPFGDTGIRSLYDDANNLGAAITAMQDNTTNTLIQSVAEDISKVFVQFAGQLALNDIETQNIPGALAINGVLTYVDHGDNQNLILNFSEEYWSAVLNTTQHYLDWGRGNFMISMLDTLGIDSNDILNSTLDTWGNGSYTVFDRVVLSTRDGGTSVIEESSRPDDTKASLFVGGDGQDDVTGSSGKDYLYGGLGDDLLNGGAGNDYIDGGTGIDTVSYGVEDLTQMRIVRGGNIFVTIDNETDTLVNVEKIYATQGNDTFIVDGAYWSGNIDVYGGAGTDRAYSGNFGPTTLFNNGDGTFSMYNQSGSGKITFHDFESFYAGRILDNENSSSTYYGNYSLLDFSAASQSGTLYSGHHNPNSQTGVHPATMTIGGIIDYVGGADYIRGTQHGDYFNLSHAGNYVGHTKLTIFTGSGNDTVTMANSANLWDKNAGLTIHYRGGNDTYNLLSGFKEIYLDSTIRFEDVTVDILGGGGHATIARLNIAGHGSILIDASEILGANYAFKPITVNFDSGGALLLYPELWYTGYPTEPYDLSERVVFTGTNNNITTHTGTWGIDEWVGRADENETYYAYDGDDILTGGAGNDTLFGGEGNDTAVYELAYQDYIFAINDDYINVFLESNLNEVDKLFDIETLQFSDLTISVTEIQYSDIFSLIPDNFIYGTNSNDDLYGSTSTEHENDYISGSFGDDRLYGYDGNDTLLGDGGNDTLYGASGHDLLEGGSGGDNLIGYVGKDTLIGGLDFDYLEGGDGDDTYIFRPGDSNSQGSSPYTEELVREDINGGIDTIKIENVDVNDVRIWSDFSNNLYIKYTETDQIRLDGIYSNDGSSNYEFIAFDDGTVWDLTNGLYLVDTDVGNDTLAGSALDDHIDGRGGADIISGRGGHDHILGGKGDDILYGENFQHASNANAGNDVLDGQEGNDTLAGNGGDDILIGGEGNDYLSGGDGFDQAVFAYNYEDYAVTKIYNSIYGYFQGGYSVTALTGNEGVDSVYSVEELVFANGKYIYDTFIPDGMYTDNNLPIAQNDEFFDIENAIISGNLFADNGFGIDIDLDGDTFYALAITAHSENDAKVVIQENGDFEYTAAANFNGMDSFTYIIHDQKGGQSTATVSVIISEVNNPPVAHDDFFIGSQNTDLIGNVINGLGNLNIVGSYFTDQNNTYDSDPDGDVLSVTAATYMTSNGSVVLSESGDFTYTPNTDFTGTDSFTYTLNDTAGNANNANVSIRVYQDVEIDDLTGENFFFGDENEISNDTILGRDGNDFVLAGYGNDRLFGHDGSDTLYGSHQNDYIEGGIGNDELYGGPGNDVYFYRLGDGHDVLSESYLSEEDAGAKNGGYDIIQFGVGINYFDIQQTSTGFQNGDLELGIQNQGSITIEDHNNGGALVQVEQLLFEDGSKMSLVNYTGHSLYVRDIVGAGSYTFGTQYDDVFFMRNTVDLVVNSNLGNDEVRYEGVFTDYSVVTKVNNGLDIISGSHTDTLWGVEKVTFTDGSYENGVFTPVISGNTSPNAQADVFSGDRDTNITGNLLLNDSDLDGDTLSVFAGTYATTNGSVLLSVNGDFTYTPNLGYVGVDFFNYAVQDGSGGIDTALVEISINSIHDTFITTSSAESFDGGFGTDTVDYSNSDSGITVNLLNNTASGGYAAGDSFVSIENIIGSDFDDQLTGTDGDNILEGGLGNDEYHYTYGDDTIAETGGINDILFLDIPSPTEADPDRVKLVRYMSNADDLQIRVDLSAASDESDIGTITVTDYFDTSSDAGRIETFTFNDALSRTVDSYEIITFADGTPSNIDGVSVGNHQQDTIYGTSATENVSAGDGVDFVYGNGGGDTIHGGNDPDALYGWDGNDTIYGDAGDDYIFGDDNATNAANTGEDMLYGGAGSDWIDGGNGNDTLYGGTEIDYLIGSAGDDILYGGDGSDHLLGGAGADTFVWLSGDVGTIDYIYDFTMSDDDVLDISDILTGYTDGVSDITEFVQITDSNGINSVVSVDVDGGADNFVTIAVLLGSPNLPDVATLESNGNLIAA